MINLANPEWLWVGLVLIVCGVFGSLIILIALEDCDNGGGTNG